MNTNITMNDKNELLNLDVSIVKKNIYNNYCGFCRVYKVIDVDTITVIIKHNSEFLFIKCRLSDIDGPEKKSKIEKEIELYNLGKEYLTKLILDKVIFIEMKCPDKYNRMLSTIYLDESKNFNINRNLLDLGLVREYHGEAKCDWDL